MVQGRLTAALNPPNSSAQPAGCPVQPHVQPGAAELPAPLEEIIYQWAGERLGGFGKIENRTLRALAELGAGRVICLMCMEADPGRCHRNTEIAPRLAVAHCLSRQHNLQHVDV
jgi:hypothetical protein